MSRPPILLDTCAVLWLGEDEDIAQPAQDALNEAWRLSQPVFVSPMTAWEIGLLASRGRLALSLSPDAWFARFMETKGLKLADMSPEILIHASYLPGLPPNDPSDRILAATARARGYSLMTRDGKLLAYGREGHLKTLAC